jgi:cytosine/adenosine deaminase-related metal-dependent hydrolase
LRFLSAIALFEKTSFLKRGSVLVVSNNEVTDIVDETNVPSDKIEYLDGIIAPGFINAHCHTELSHLKNVIPQHTGLVEFARLIVSNRSNYTESVINDAAMMADRDMISNGIVAVGDICNTSLSIGHKVTSKIYYHSFIELIGLNPNNKDKIVENGLILKGEFDDVGLSASLAPHAPYSTSNELIDLVEQKNGGAVSSIHNQESEEEAHFFMGNKSQINDLYSFLKIPIDFFIAPKSTSLANYYNRFNSKQNILVHNTFTSKKDLELVGKSFYWCFCPNANLYIENKLPDYSLFKDQVDKICIGTDSLASNGALDICSEINTILNASSVFTLEQLLQAATYNGAKALQLNEKFGTLYGELSCLNLLDYSDNKLRFKSKLA